MEGESLKEKRGKNVTPHIPVVVNTIRYCIKQVQKCVTFTALGGTFTLTGMTWSAAVWFPATVHLITAKGSTGCKSYCTEVCTAVDTHMGMWRWSMQISWTLLKDKTSFHTEVEDCCMMVSFFDVCFCLCSPECLHCEMLKSQSSKTWWKKWIHEWTQHYIKTLHKHKWNWKTIPVALLWRMFTTACIEGEHIYLWSSSDESTIGWTVKLLPMLQHACLGFTRWSSISAPERRQG